MGDRIERIKEVKDTIRRLTESTNLGSERLNYQTKYMQGLDLGPPYMCSNV